MMGGTSIWVEIDLELLLIEKEGFAMADAKIRAQCLGLDRPNARDTYSPEAKAA